MSQEQSKTAKLMALQRQYQVLEACKELPPVTLSKSGEDALVQRYNFILLYMLILINYITNSINS